MIPTLLDVLQFISGYYSVWKRFDDESDPRPLTDDEIQEFEDSEIIEISAHLITDFDGNTAAETRIYIE
jgi:hypothetical protein